MMKTTLYFMLKVLFVEIFTFLSWHFGYVEKRFDKKAMVKFKISDVTDWTTNNYNIYVAQYVGQYVAQSQEVKATRQWNLVT